MKKITVIGSGNAFHDDGRAHACLLLEHSGGRRVLIDAGATALHGLRRKNIALESIDGVVLTHFHGDHYLGLPFLLLHANFVEHRERPFVIAGPPGVEARCRSLIELAYEDVDYSFEIQFIEASAPLSLHGFEITPMPVTHSAESTGYRIEGPAKRTIAVSGDAILDDRLWKLIDGVELSIIELGLLEQRDPPLAHIAVDELLDQRERLHEQRIVFVHLDDATARAVREHRLGEAATDGMEISL
ncbi:MAG: MBL fold metallo-hydrolase [Acidobacteriota bacterium]|nr:MAG: MBL fold metallo-hydrolase [Acidobacteriota bacterium]